MEKSAYNIPRGIDEEISHALDASEQEEVKTKSVFTKQLRHFAHSISKQNCVVCNILCFLSMFEYFMSMFLQHTWICICILYSAVLLPIEDGKMNCNACFLLLSTFSMNHDNSYSANDNQMMEKSNRTMSSQVKSPLFI